MYDLTCSSCPNSIGVTVDDFTRVAGNWQLTVAGGNITAVTCPRCQRAPEPRPLTRHGHVDDELRDRDA